MRDPQSKEQKSNSPGNSEGAQSEGISFTPPAFALTADPVQRQAAPATTPAQAPTGPNLAQAQWLAEVQQRCGQDQSAWPFHERLRYHVYDFPDSRGLPYLQDMIVEKGPISNATVKDGVITLIQEFYPATGTHANLGALLIAYVQGGFDAMSSLMPGQDPEQVYREGGFDAMALHIHENTTVRRSGNNYNPTDDSMRLADDEYTMGALQSMGYWADLDRRAVNMAEDEHSLWNGPGGQQRNETDPAMLPHLQRYWGVTHGDSSANRLAGVSAAADPDNAYWSAVFISTVMHRAGAGDTFAYGDAHGVYGRDAKNNESAPESEVTHPQRLFNATGSQAAAVHVGGLIHRNRTGTSVSYARMGGGSHADIVVGIEVHNMTSAPLTAPVSPVFTSYELLQAHVLSTVPDPQKSSMGELEINALVQEYITNNNLELYAVTIGGNTNDEDQHDVNVRDETTNSRGRTRRRNRYTGVQRNAHSTGGTVGRRYWALNPDRTANNDRNLAINDIYAVQEQELPADLDVDFAMERGRGAPATP